MVAPHSDASNTQEDDCGDDASDVDGDDYGDFVFKKLSEEDHGGDNIHVSDEEDDAVNVRPLGLDTAESSDTDQIGDPMQVLC